MYPAYRASNVPPKIAENEKKPCTAFLMQYRAKAAFNLLKQVVLFKNYVIIK
jgi:hypothetical protein